jgi:hypothetical protein
MQQSQRWLRPGLAGVVLAAVLAVACTPDAPLTRTPPVVGPKKSPTPKPSASASASSQASPSVSPSTAASNSPSPSPSASATAPPGAVPLQTAVTTYAGTGGSGLVEGPARDAKFSGPVALVTYGQMLFIADQGNNRVRKITSDGTVSTFAGEASALGAPKAIAVDPKDGTIYLAEPTKIRRITADGSTTLLAGADVAGFADQPGSLARFKEITALAVDSTGTLLVGDSGNFRIRKVTKTGEVATAAGGATGNADGNGVNAQFVRFGGFTLEEGDTLYFTDGNRVRRANTTFDVATLAGKPEAGFADGAATAAQFNEPTGIVRTSGRHLIVADTKNHRLRTVIFEASGAVTVGTLAGSTAGYEDEMGTTALYNSPMGLTIDALDTLFIADRGNLVIRKTALK